LRGTSSRYKRNALIIVLLFLLSFTGLYIYGSFYTATGFSNIEYKRIENNNYYIFVRNGNRVIRLECDKDDYEKITVDSYLVYGISYRWSTLMPNKGKLLYINFNDVIDNRH
jgi:hypothetical protein